MTNDSAHVARALVLDAHSSAGIEVVQSLGRAGIGVDAASEQPECLGFVSRYPDRRYPQPAAGDPDTFNSWLRELDDQRQYSLIVPTTENSLSAVNNLHKDDPLRAKALLPSPESIQIALSKEATWQHANRLGIRVPQSRLITSIDQPVQAMPFPVVLKPVRSLVNIAGTTELPLPVIARTEHERTRALEGLLMKSPVLEQSYVSGRGLGVECLYESGRLIWFFVHERIHELPLTGGGSTYRRSVTPDTPAVRVAKRLLDTLNWHGVAMVEFKLQPDETVCLIEINPRLWGSLALAIDSGVNFPLAMWQISRGATPAPQPRYEVAYHTRHIVRDLDWTKDNWRADHGDPLLLTRPRLQSLVEHMRLLTFRESWDHFDIHDLRVTLRQLRSILRDGLLSPLIRRLHRAWLELRMRAQFKRVISGMNAGAIPVNRVLFVCYGNICRSPFAERYALLNGLKAELASAGFHAVSGRASPAHLLRAAGTLDVQMDDWRSKTISTDLVANADLILTMDSENYLMMQQRFPQARNRTVPLALFDGGRSCEIRDPYGMNEEETAEILATIANSIDGLEQVLRLSR